MKFHINKSVLVLPAIFSTAFFSFAKDDIIIVSAGKIEQSQSQSIEKVQVISSEQIKESGAKTLTEAVKNLPGVVINGASAGNPTESISMQGFDSDYVKVLIDGIAVSGDIGGSTAVFQIPVEDIDHIEVVQGASSALYGSDAMGGVINIITKKTKQEFDGIKLHGSLSQEFSYSIKKDWRNYTAGSISVAGENLSTNLSGSFDFAPGLKKSAYYALAGGFVDYYATPKKQVCFLRATTDWKDDWGKIGAYGTYAYANQLSNYTPAGFSAGSSMEYTTNRIEGGISGEYRYDSDLSFSGFSSVKKFLLDTDYNVDAGLDSSKTDTDSSFLDWESEVRSSWTFNEDNQFLFGLNGIIETIDGKSFKTREKQILLSLFAQDTIKFVDLFSVVPGIRFDYSPAIKTSSNSFMLTPKLSFRFNPAEDTIIRFSYGMGYKTPTLKQKYWEFRHNYSSGEGNFILYGNPNLKSEKSQSFNLSLEQNLFSNTQLNLSGYFNYVIDMIDSIVTNSLSDPQERRYVNIDKALTYGGDISLNTKFDRFNAKISYAYTGAKQKDNGKWIDMALRVTHRISAGASYLIPKIEAKLSSDVQWNSRQRLTAGKNKYTPDFFMVEATLSKTFNQEKFELYVRADNVLNNLNFKKGSDGSNQKQYYGLNSGTIFAVGGRLKF